MRSEFVKRALLSLFAASSLLGCEAAVEENLDESAANAVVVALHDAEIGGRKEAMEGDGERFRVLVPADDVGDALRALRTAGLPRGETTGFDEVFGEGGLVPTATEEQARFITALGGELAASIEGIEGVLDARVHVAPPDTRRISLDDTPPSARASVLIRYRGSTPPYEDESIRSLVSGAVQHMRPEDVAIVGVSVAAPNAAASSRLVSVGPFAVTRGSATSLKLTLAAALLVHLVLAGLLLVAMRRRRAAPLPLETPPVA